VALRPLLVGSPQPQPGDASAGHEAPAGSRRGQEAERAAPRRERGRGVSSPSGRATSRVCTARSVSGASGPVPGGTNRSSACSRRRAMISPAGRRPSRRDSLTEWRLGPPETRLPSRKRGTLTQKGPMRCRPCPARSTPGTTPGGPLVVAEPGEHVSRPAALHRGQREHILVRHAPKRGQAIGTSILGR
jgi:hypothetical protein